MHAYDCLISECDWV